MRIGPKKIGVGLLVLAVALLAALFQPGVPQDSSEAALATPGGASAMPSAAPGIPLVTNQYVPAIAPASGSGAMAVAGIFCDAAVCPDGAGGTADGLLNITFEITKVFPPDAPVAATFAASGGTSLVCADNATCDMSNSAGAVFVTVAGGGVNEVVKVTGTDESGDSRSVNVMFVETIFAVNPVNSGAGTAATLVSYRCPDVGSIPADTDGDGVTLNDAGDADWENLLESIYLQAGVVVQFDPLNGVPQYTCGGDTGDPLDDRVSFETDEGILTVEEVADFTTAVFGAGFGTVDVGCDVGDSVDVLDGNGGALFGAVFGTFCDLDWADNGVVTYGLLGTGDVGVASVTSQQSGGGGPLRSINVTFAGAPASTSYNLEIQGPSLIGLTGDDFTMIVTDADGRPIAGQTVECSVDPVEGGLAFLPQTGTSNGDGEVDFSLIPTGSSVLAGQELTITCFLDSDPDVRATRDVGTSLEPETETVDLASGCNFVSWTGADETAPADVAAGASPAEALSGLWAQQPAPDWKGFNPEFPEVSDMGPVSQLDVVAVCMAEAGTFTRPVL